MNENRSLLDNRDIRILLGTVVGAGLIITAYCFAQLGNLDNPQVLANIATNDKLTVEQIRIGFIAIGLSSLLISTPAAVLLTRKR